MYFINIYIYMYTLIKDSVKPKKEVEIKDEVMEEEQVSNSLVFCFS